MVQRSAASIVGNWLFRECSRGGFSQPRERRARDAYIPRQLPPAAVSAHTHIYICICIYKHALLILASAPRRRPLLCICAEADL